MRTDAWWIQPLLVFLGLSAFIVYSTWAALQGNNYFLPGTHYLSPMYSPVLFDSWKLTEPSGHAWFGAWPTWLPKSILILPLTPAFLILWAPGGFRFTCYYYRGAYYKAFWADPPACSVGEPRSSYIGEHAFPLILQNIHRYFLVLAVIVLGFLAADVYKALWWINQQTGAVEFGVGVGTLVLAINLVMLSGYTFGCHSMRHVVGGMMDRLSTSRIRTLRQT